MKFYKVYRDSWTYSNFAYLFKDKDKDKLKYISVEELINRLEKKEPIIDNILNTMQDIIYFPTNILHSLRIYISNRFFTKTHLLTSNLPIGEWYEYDARIVNVLSDSFIRWMETEYCNCYKPSPEKMIEKHLWESNLKRDEGMGVEVDSEVYGTPTNQAIAAKKLFEIYQYWKYQRPTLDVDEYSNVESDTKYLTMIIENRMSMWT